MISIQLHTARSCRAAACDMQQLARRRVARVVTTFVAGRHRSGDAAAHEAAAVPAVTLHPEVADALACGRAVVALESTIISHGMPYPENLECARQVEARVRAHGAVPATCAIIGGEPRVGLDEAALQVSGPHSGPRLPAGTLAVLCFVGEPATDGGHRARLGLD
jgi:hypothetical protein